MAALIVSTLVSLAWLAVMFVPLERCFPARPGQRLLRAGFWTDLAFFWGQRMVFVALVAGALSTVAPWIDGIEALEPVRQRFGTAPLVVQLVAILVLGDLITYWGHRLQHRVGFLWRFHAVHHSATEVDWLAAHREHPLDGLYTQALINLPMLLLGFRLDALLGVIAFRAVWAIFIHSNVRLPLGPLRYLIGCPSLHRWHHACEREAGNYANLAPWIDLLFGTYRRPAGDPAVMGVEAPMPKGYLGLLLHPFRRRGSGG